MGKTHGYIVQVRQAATVFETAAQPASQLAGYLTKAQHLSAIHGAEQYITQVRQAATVFESVAQPISQLIGYLTKAQHLSADQRAQIWLFCNEHSEAWKKEQARIAEEANRKRSEAMQGVPYAPKGESRKPEEKVVQQSVGIPSTPPDKNKSQIAKAQQAKVNAGAIARRRAGGIAGGDQGGATIRHDELGDAWHRPLWARPDSGGRCGGAATNSIVGIVESCHGWRCHSSDRGGSWGYRAIVLCCQPCCVAML